MFNRMTPRSSCDWEARFSFSNERTWIRFSGKPGIPQNNNNNNKGLLSKIACSPDRQGLNHRYWSIGGPSRGLLYVTSVAASVKWAILMAELDCCGEGVTTDRGSNYVGDI